MRKLNYLIWLLFLAAFISCSDDSDDDNSTDKVTGVFVVNEGSSEGGSISMFSPETKTMKNNYFEEVNGRIPGLYIQSFCAMENRGFIVSNGSKKIEIVDMETFKTVGVIQAEYPRYSVHAGENKAYITNGSYAGHVYVVDIAAASITDSIEVGNGPENLITVNNKAYVANSGGWTADNTISVIDTKTDKVVKTVTVKDNPTDIVADASNNIWVLCKGKPNWSDKETASYLIKINTTSYEIEKEIKIADNAHPQRLAIGSDKQYLYYENNGICKVSVTASEAPAKAFIEGNFYGIEVNPETGNIYGFTYDFAKAAKMIRYQADGTKIDEYEIGLGPNGAFFMQ